MGGQSTVGILLAKPFFGSRNTELTVRKMLIIKCLGFELCVIIIKVVLLSVDYVCYPVMLLFLLKLAFNVQWLTRFPALERKELRNINNNCSTKAGGDALSTLAYSMRTHIHILAHIPDRHTQNSLAWQQDPVKQINKLLIRGGKCDWSLSSKAMIYCACHHHLKVTPTLGQWDRPK